MEIVLATINSRYAHASLALRYLYANLGALRPRAQILEFSLSQDPQTIASILSQSQPKIIGLGVYIWNVSASLEVVRHLKKICPQTTIVLGGPEVSHESESQVICQCADYVIQGEGDQAFPQLCSAASQPRDLAKIHASAAARGERPGFSLCFLYRRRHSPPDDLCRASRGCPYRCEFCLSSLDETVRNFPLPEFLDDLATLMDRGVRQFKFIDRTFNLSPKISASILQFFLDRVETPVFLHFEMIPDRLPEDLRRLISQFPPGRMQFEVGIQTWNPEVSARISRRQNYAKIMDNLTFLREKTGVYLHADLIAGLPGETEESFAQGFNHLLALAPHEIQVGILKRLKGTPISRHDQAWEMIYDKNPPFQILQTKTMDAACLTRINRFAKYWDTFANSGNFPRGFALLKNAAYSRSFYHLFMDLSEALFRQYQRTYGLGLSELTQSLLAYMIGPLGLPQATCLAALSQDYAAGGKRDVPQFLQSSASRTHVTPPPTPSHIPKRQARHLLNRQSYESAVPGSGDK